MTLFALLLGLPGLAQAAPAGLIAESTLTANNVASRFSLDAILDAIRAIESGGHRNGGRDATGDGGHAIGPYQIHRAYFLDAGAAGRYADCRDPDYARRVVIAYWKRWCPDALESCDAEVLSRVHNGGPKGAKKPSTLAYWRKVERRLVAALDASVVVFDRVPVPTLLLVAQHATPPIYHLNSELSPKPPISPRSRIEATGPVQAPSPLSHSLAREGLMPALFAYSAW